MIKAIEKKCYIYEDCITLRFIDTRDNYIYPTALGDIGEINICENYVFLSPNDYDDDKLEDKREKVLHEAFQEIFGTQKIDYLSNEYYKKLKNMIATGSLKSLGYKISTPSEEEDTEEIFSYYNKKQHRKH